MNRQTLFLIFLILLGVIITIVQWCVSGTSPGVQWSFALAKQNVQLAQILGDPGAWKISDDSGGRCGGGGESFGCGFNYKITGPNGAVRVFVHWEEHPNMPTRKEVTVRVPQGDEITLYSE